MLNFRHNVMSVCSLNSFVNIKGGVNGDCKDVYFVRAVGVNDSFFEDVEKMDAALIGRVKSGAFLYKRVSSLPRLVSPDEASYYSGQYEEWCINGKTKIKSRTEVSDEFSEVLSDAFRKTLDLYCRSKAGSSSSIEKNFAVKMMYWLDNQLEDFVRCWNIRYSMKIAADNITKNQEYLFFYMLTLLGCDVLLLQSRSDIGTAEKAFSLSSEFRLGEFSDKPVPEFRPERVHNKTIKESSVGDSSAPIKMTIPQRPGRAAASAVIPQRPGTIPSASGGIVIPERPVRSSSPSRSIVMPGRTGGSHTDTATRVTASDKPRREKAFEELARLASSVVMIAICDVTGKVTGTGSGIMIGREGYILTNNHVASGGRYYSVRIEDDDNLYDTDEIIKYNPMLDLAIIRINRTLNPIPVYNGAQKLVRGQKVVAIGSPMGLFNSVSDGIISGFRKIRDVDMIQFTAPTSHGSSGGAVLNMYGEVIGISTAGIDEGQNLNLAMGYECINGFIRGFI